MSGGVIGVGQPHWIIGAVVEQEAVAQCQDAAFVIKCTFDVVELITPMSRTDEVFRAVLDPFHRPAELKRQEWDEDFLGVNKHFGTESSPNVRRNYADSRFGKIELGGDNGEANGVSITAHAADVGDNADTLDATVEGQATTIAFNARYLIDVLSALGADEAALELSGPLAPGVIRGIGKDDYVHVIMPVRTAS